MSCSWHDIAGVSAVQRLAANGRYFADIGVTPSFALGVKGDISMQRKVAQEGQ
jgi:hypothetical protein